ncbi:MAG TPA: hypothetical protein VHZ64_14350 [Xanthobacteraceae bacterium]|jgi:hypothetical protein|nr:hypothetical protein [Xanthobacteraceae bacterium]
MSNGKDATVILVTGAPSSLAGPLNGAEIPNRISVSVTPRTAGAGSAVATRAGALLAGCGVAGAAGTPALGALD